MLNDRSVTVDEDLFMFDFDHCVRAMYAFVGFAVDANFVPRYEVVVRCGLYTGS